MSDQGFDFQKPVERREAKSFEPPPWETAQFEEFARARAERESAAVDEPVETVSPSAELAAAITEAAREKEAAQSAVQEAVAGEDPTEGSEQDAADEVADEAAAAPVISDAHLEAMLVRLASEEPKADKAVAGVKYGVGLFLGSVGSVVLIWGIAGMTKASAVASKAGAPPAAKSAVWAGAILTVFGVILVTVAGWLVVRTLRERGVL